MPTTLPIERDVSLRGYNSFGLPAVARRLVRVASDADVRRVVDHPEFGRAPKFILGGGSNIVLTHDVESLVVKIEVRGRRLVQERADAWIVEAGAGETWHDFVGWTLQQGWPGLENLALIPGTVGAAPIQNIGAYGVELKDVFECLEAFNLEDGYVHSFCLDDCCFGYRNSVFKSSLKGKFIIISVTLKLNKKSTFNTSY